MSRLLIAIGVTLGVLGLLLFSGGYLLGTIGMELEDESEIASELDFIMMGPGRYSHHLEMISSEGFLISIGSGNDTEIAFNMTIADDHGRRLLHVSESTPYSERVTGSGIILTCDIIIALPDVNASIHDLRISIKTSEPSDAGTALCCLGIITPGLGAIMALTGLILSMIGFSRRDRVVIEPGESAFNRPQDIDGLLRETEEPRSAPAIPDE
ncbi:MAG: hypothetical protein QCI82_10260 [Candidatus Thermoplasmatota archaeon]|nr:hypothetical protein [Candidatus Thermoplasmatota archaeon]